tara:strand:+ start:168 stop:599 length:432 start_codon:yes stop_codon:yes gene_type:complete
MIKSVSINDQTLYNQYLNLRWSLLRKPLGGARGTEIDIFESESFHRAIFDHNDNIIGVGRIHFIQNTAQIRYMAIIKEFRSKGLGSKLIKELENIALENNIKKIFLNSRFKAVDFYIKNGYVKIASVKPPFGNIIHYRMEKIF